MTRCIYVYHIGMYHIGMKGRKERKERKKRGRERIFVVGERRVFYGGGK